MNRTIKLCIAAFTAAIFTIILSLAGGFGASVGAEEPDWSNVTWQEISNYTDLKKYCTYTTSPYSSCQYIKLSKNITFSSNGYRYAISIKKDLTINLNGHTIDHGYLGGTYYTDAIFSVESGGNLTIIDEPDIGIDTEGKLTNSYNNNNKESSGGGAVLLNAADAVFNLYSGNIWGNTTTQAKSGSGVSIYNGTFNMYGGTISSNTNNKGCAVYVSSYGTFNMYGGSIIGNTSSSGSYGTVYVNGGTFNMTGGCIESNDGNGVYLYDNSTMNVSGHPVVASNNDRNVILNSSVQINITDELTPDASIGVTGDSKKAITSEYPEDYSDYFHPDNSEQSVVYDSDSKKLKLYRTDHILSPDNVTFSRENGLEVNGEPVLENDYSIVCTDEYGDPVSLENAGFIFATITGNNAYFGQVEIVIVNNVIVSYNWDDENTCIVTIEDEVGDKVPYTFENLNGSLSGIRYFKGINVSLSSEYSSDVEKGILKTTKNIIDDTAPKIIVKLKAVYTLPDDAGEDVYIKAIGFDLTIIKGETTMVKHFEKTCESGSAEYELVLGGMDITSVTGTAFVTLSDGTEYTTEI